MGGGGAMLASVLCAVLCGSLRYGLMLLVRLFLHARAFGQRLGAGAAGSGRGTAQTACYCEKYHAACTAAAAAAGAAPLGAAATPAAAAGWLVWSSLDTSWLKSGRGAARP
mmetsp:Transcript_1487/g.4011  ORF Transcript_1487/g.4011 Transcript_1487/m.4011 type:complete len:111 (+) Transcript_1487:611-943(+)